jgi:hypothetical protein
MYLCCQVLLLTLKVRSRHSPVGIATRLPAGQPKNLRFPTGTKVVRFSIPSGRALGPHKPCIHWALRALASGLKQPGCEADHSPPCGAKVKNAWSYTFSSTYVFVEWWGLSVWAAYVNVKAVPNSNGRSLPSHRGRPGSCPGSMCVLWWTKWHWGRFSPSTSVSPANHHSTNFSIPIMTRTGIMGLLVAAVPGGLNWTPPLYNLNKYIKVIQYFM